LMPALSPTMEKGNLAKWLKKEGDPVKAGDIIAEIETDKATMEVEAADEGVLAKIVVPEGTADVPVNQLIAVLAGEGEDVKAAAGACFPRRWGGGSRAKPASTSVACRARGRAAASSPAISRRQNPGRACGRLARPRPKHLPARRSRRARLRMKRSARCSSRAA